MDKLSVGVSACLLGQPVRFDRGHKREPFLVETLAPFVAWTPVCPELEAGMGLPREPVRLVATPGGHRLRGTRTRTDWTAAMSAAAEARVATLGELDGFVLKRKSPSCGMERVKVYPEDGGMPARDGVGLFAAALRRRWPNLPVEEEGRLRDPRLRAAFLERLFVYRRLRRLRRLWAGPWRARHLVAFHTAHKMALLAHWPEGYRRLGRLVAQAGTLPRESLRAAYESLLTEVLARPVSPGRHANVLLHLLGHLRDRIDPADTDELLVAIERQRQGLAPLAVPLALLRHHARRAGVSYLAAQTYLQPHPPELGSHV